MHPRAHSGRPVGLRGTPPQCLKDQAALGLHLNSTIHLCFFPSMLGGSHILPRGAIIRGFTRVRCISAWLMVQPVILLFPIPSFYRLNDGYVIVHLSLLIWKGITVPIWPVSSITMRNCEGGLEIVTPGTSGQCLGLPMSQQRGSIAQLFLQRRNLFVQLFICDLTCSSSIKW